VLPRLPGTKESRFMHLFSGDAGPVLPAEAVPETRVENSAMASGDHERITQLEAEVAELRRELETLREQCASFQRQFQ